MLAVFLNFQIIMYTQLKHYVHTIMNIEKMFLQT